MSDAAIYAGTFDPLTLGHLDLLERAAHIFDRVILAVASSSRKKPLFSLEERVEMAKNTLKGHKNIEIDSFSGLLVDYAHEKGVHIVIRGLRAFSDFENEFQMALTNRQMAPDIETIFLMPKENFSDISSSAVREIVELGGDASSFVPQLVQKALKNKLK